MNNRDELIWRNDALNACYEGWNWDDKTIEHIYENITQIPAVPHEMSVEEWLTTLRRMCHGIPCYDCPFDKYKCGLECTLDFVKESDIKFVEKWARDHPERSGDNVGDKKQAYKEVALRHGF